MMRMKKIVSFFGSLNWQQRRAAFVVAVMQAKGITYQEIGRRAPGKPVTKHLVSACVRGLQPWSPRIIMALEATLGLSLRVFLLPEEAARLKRFKAA